MVGSVGFDSKASKRIPVTPLTRVLGPVFLVFLLAAFAALPAAPVGRDRLLLLAVHVGFQLLRPLEVLNALCS